MEKALREAAAVFRKEMWEKNEELHSIQVELRQLRWDVTCAAPSPAHSAILTKGCFFRSTILFVATTAACAL